jgi:hypothetical protein
VVDRKNVDTLQGTPKCPTDAGFAIKRDVEKLRTMVDKTEERKETRAARP